MHGREIAAKFVVKQEGHEYGRGKSVPGGKQRLE
jgi:hypothetical protein